jgi:hypothetical protein
MRKAKLAAVLGLFLRPSFGYIFAWEILTWRPRPPLLPEFLGTSPGVPNRSHGSAATACHSVSAVDFARRGRQYLAREMFPVVGNLI